MVTAHFSLELSFLKEGSRVFGTTDPYEVSDYVNRHIGYHHMTVGTRKLEGAELRHRKMGFVDLCHISYGNQARVLSEGLGDIYHLQFVLQGQCHYELRGDGQTLGPGDLLLINQGDPVDLTYSADCDKFILKIPTRLFDEVCLEHRWLQPQGGIRFEPVAYRFGEVAGLAHLLSLVCQEVESGYGSSQIHGHYNRVIASKLLTQLKHNLRLEMPSAASVSFDRLTQYIEDNIKRDISGGELAKLARMSLRSLYLLFERHAKTTPMCFIKQRKLERVRSALRDPTVPAVNVTAVALDHGFTHLGRFSEAYKTAFGVLPSEDLRNHSPDQ
jgi:AraC-like DNA-binding protein